MTTSGRAGRALGQALLNVAALGGLVCIVLVILAFFFNITLIMFKTGSMSPTIPAGSLAVVREIPASDIRVGDVLTVNREGKLPVTHRVTSISGSGDARTITMKGDANDAEDPSPYTVTEARRVLLSVPELAKVVVWFSNPIVLGSITLAASVLVTWAFWPRASKDAPGVRERGKHRGQSPGPAAEDTKRISAAALAAVLLGGVAVAMPVIPDASQASVPQRALSADSTVVTRGSHLTLTSIGDAEAMTDMQPGVPVLWQVGVQVSAPDPGTVVLSLSAEGSSGLGLELEIRECAVRWVLGTCGSGEVLLQSRQPAQLGPVARPLNTMRSTEERWVLISATVPAEGRGSVSLALRADGTSDAAVATPGTGGVLARTGASVGGDAQSTGALWLGAGAVSAGLLVAGVARIAKRGQSEVSA